MTFYYKDLKASAFFMKISIANKKIEQLNVLKTQ